MGRAHEEVRDMWAVKDNDIKMAEGDWGIELPITIGGITFSQNDVLKFVFKDKMNGDVVLEKEFTPVEGTVKLVLTEAETALFPMGAYVYSLDWYQDGAFLCNIIPSAVFRVVDKA